MRRLLLVGVLLMGFLTGGLGGTGLLGGGMGGWGAPVAPSDWSNHRYLGILATVDLPGTMTIEVAFLDGYGAPFTVTYNWAVSSLRAGLEHEWYADLPFPAEAFLPRMYDVDTVTIRGLVAGQRILLSEVSILEQRPGTWVAAPDQWPRLKVVFPDSLSGDPTDWMSISSVSDGVLGFDQVYPVAVQNGQEKGLVHVAWDAGIADNIERTLQDCETDLDGREGYTATLDQPAIDAALEDADGNRLYPSDWWCLLQETLDARQAAVGGAWEGTLRAMPKARSVKLAACSQYVARPRKIIRGGIHGLAYTGTRDAAAGADAAINLRRVDTGALVATTKTGDWSEFDFTGLYELLTYQVQDGGAGIAMSGVLGITNEEWTWAEAPYTEVGKRLCSIRDKIGELVVYAASNGILSRYLSTDDRLFDKHPPVAVGAGWNPSAWERSKDSPWHEVAFDLDLDVYTEAGNCFGASDWGLVRSRHISAARIVAAEYLPNEGAGKVLYLSIDGKTVYTDELRRQADGAHLAIAAGQVDVTGDFDGMLPRPGSGYLKATPNDFLLFWDDGASIYAALSPRAFTGDSEWFNHVAVGVGRLVGCCYLQSAGMGVVIAKTGGPAWVVYNVYRRADNTLRAEEVGASTELASVAPEVYGDMVQNPCGVLILSFFDSAGLLKTARSRTFGRDWEVT